MWPDGDTTRETTVAKYVEDQFEYRYDWRWWSFLISLGFVRLPAHLAAPELAAHQLCGCRCMDLHECDAQHAALCGFVGVMCCA